MFDSKFGIFLSTAAITLAISACKKDDDKSGGVVRTEFQSSRINTGALINAEFALARAHGTPLKLLDARGRASGAEVESLKYLISGISLCGKLNTAGSGSSCGSGVWDIYGNRPHDYDSFGPAEALATDSGYVDFMNKDSLKELGSASSYSDGNVGSYDSVQVYWYRPFKVKAKVKLNDGTTVYTKASSLFESNDKAGLDVTYQTTVSGITSGPAEEGVFFLPNGGTFFKLQTPFSITKADIDNKTTFSVVFAFDPDDQITALKFDPAVYTPDTQWRVGMVDPTLGYRIDAPLLQVAPVVARPGETVMREVYLFRSADNIHDVRLSLYSIKEDASRAVRAATITNMLNGTPSQPMDWMQANAVETAADGTVSIKDWAGLNIITGLKRQGSEVQSMTHEYCTGHDESFKCTGSATRTYSAAYVGEGTLEADITASYTAPELDENGQPIP